MSESEAPTVCAMLPGRPPINEKTIALALEIGMLAHVETSVMGEASTLAGFGSPIETQAHPLFDTDVKRTAITLRCTQHDATQLAASGRDHLVIRLNRYVCLLVRIALADAPSSPGDLVVHLVGLVGRADDGHLYLEALRRPSFDLVPTRDMTRLVAKIRLVANILREHDDRYLSDERLDRLARADLRFGMTGEVLAADLVALAHLAVWFPTRFCVKNRGIGGTAFDFRPTDPTQRDVFRRDDVVRAMELLVSHYAGQDPFVPTPLFSKGLVAFNEIGGRIDIAPTARDEPILDVTLFPPSALERADATARVHAMLARLAREDAEIAGKIALLVSLP